MIIIPVYLAAPMPAFALQADTAAPAPVRVSPVPLPDASLPDADYKRELAALFADSAKRPGLYVSLYNLIDRDVPPPHVDIIVAQLMPLVNGSNPVATIIPLKVVGLCGAAGRGASKKALFLSTSPLAKVRLAATESLGGMFYAPPGTKPFAPEEVISILVSRLQSDSDRGTKRAAAVALGRCRVASRSVVLALAATTGADDAEVALGALSALTALGHDAKLALPALQKRLLDRDTSANTVPALLAVASPQEAADALSFALAQAPTTPAFYTDPANIEYLQTVFHHAARMPIAGANTAPLADVILRRAQAVPMPDGSPDLLPLRLSAAQAAAHLSKNTAQTATAFAQIAASDGDSATRRTAVRQITKIGKPALQSPAVIPALLTVLGTTDTNLQNAALGAVTTFGGSGTAPLAPRLSEILLAAWKAKQESRVATVMNALFRMGAGAAPAKPVLQTIAKAEPNSTTGNLARAVLNNLSAASGTASR